DVQTPIASFARVCAHDRPGRGASGPPPDGLDARGYVALLRNLLKAGDEPPPYVFVGHSLGGLSAQLYASLHPSEIAGLVLVDSSHQDQIRRMAVLPQRTPPPAPPPLPPEAVSLQAFVDALAPLPWALDVPLVVLTRSRWTAGADTPDDAARLALWTELQRNLATRSQQSEHIIATNSGHYIQNDDPSLLVEAIRRMAGMR
ncbi:MAG: alpha/beta hydrolase, partial [Acidobacteriota bacterium]|nr:alpha/beta hydrolase [Acidobacteriota bacterium]